MLAKVLLRSQGSLATWSFVTGKRFYGSSAPAAVIPPRKPSQDELQQKYGEYGYLFEKELPPLVKYYDPYDKHKQLIAFSYVNDFEPHVDPHAFVAPNATVAGNVEVWVHSTIMYGAVIRGDSKLVRIGAWSNVQDNCTISDLDAPLHYDHDGSTIIGSHVTIGHSCHLVACTIENCVLVGMNSVLCPDSYMETQSILAAHSVLSRGSRVKSGELWAGNPARFIRKLTDDEILAIMQTSERYGKIKDEHRAEFYLPIGTNYIEAQKIDPTIGIKTLDF